jgi:hypothetical protein
MDVHPAAQNNNSPHVPQNENKFSGDSTSSPDEFLAEINNWFFIFGTLDPLRPPMCALFLSEPAKEWY